MRDKLREQISTIVVEFGNSTYKLLSEGTPDNDVILPSISPYPNRHNDNAVLPKSQLLSDAVKNGILSTISNDLA